MPNHHPAPRTRPPRRFRGVAAVPAAALSLALVLGACGGSDDDSASGADKGATTTAADSGSDTRGGSAHGDDATSTTTSAGGDLDVCAEITKEDVGAILTGATITDARPNDAIAAPNCSYYVAMDGFPDGAAVASIVWNDPAYYDSQKELQADAQDVPELGDGFLLETGSPMVLVKGETGAFQVTQGVELTAGGEPATAEQLVAIAELTEGL